MREDTLVHIPLISLSHMIYLNDFHTDKTGIFVNYLLQSLF